jgi:hypothetical protein
MGTTWKVNYGSNLDRRCSTIAVMQWEVHFEDTSRNSRAEGERAFDECNYLGKCRQPLHGERGELGEHSEHWPEDESGRSLKNQAAIRRGNPKILLLPILSVCSLRSPCSPEPRGVIRTRGMSYIDLVSLWLNSIPFVESRKLGEFFGLFKC